MGALPSDPAQRQVIEGQAAQCNNPALLCIPVINPLTMQPTGIEAACSSGAGGTPAPGMGGAPAPGTGGAPAPGQGGAPTGNCGKNGAGTNTGVCLTAAAIQAARPGQNTDALTQNTCANAGELCVPLRIVTNNFQICQGAELRGLAGAFQRGPLTGSCLPIKNDANPNGYLEPARANQLGKGTGCPLDEVCAPCQLNGLLGLFSGNQDVPGCPQANDASYPAGFDVAGYEQATAAEDASGCGTAPGARNAWWLLAVAIALCGLWGWRRRRRHMP
jgi:hypothetical protein